MKKLSVILLLSLYALSVSGAAVQLHYCCGKIDSISIGYNKTAEAGCKHGQQYKMSGCCNDQQVLIDVDHEQGLSGNVLAPILPTTDLPVSFTELSIAIPAAIQITANSTRGSPPGSAEIPLYILNSVFRN